MIERINIRNVASYDEHGVVIDRLKKVNFFFGANGSGKTTISRIIANDQTDKYPDCSIDWVNGTANECLVYNQDFVKENFRPHEDLKGIFTLGKAEADVQKKLEADQNILTSIKGKLESYEETKKGQEREFNHCAGSFETGCWDNLKEKYQDEFGDLIVSVIFASLNKSKKRFADHILTEYKNCKTPFEADIEQLKQQAQTVFNNAAEPENNIEILDRNTIAGLAEIMSSPLLKKEIIGRQNSSFGEFIQKLGNSDWVRQGLHYIHKAGEPCPFCQQDIGSDILAHIQDLFDEQYNKDIASLASIRAKYDELRESILNSFNMAQNAPEQFLDRADFDNLKKRLKAILDKNQLIIKDKIATPSKAVWLDNVSSVVTDAQNFLKSVNARIAEYNDAIKNRSQRKKELVQSFWDYIIYENHVFIENYLKQRVGLEKELTQSKEEMDSLTDKKLTLEREIKTLRDSVAGVEETANSINNILRQYGFVNFRLVTSGEKNEFYKLIRSDGTEAKETLSEGEFSFIAFLYFYYLVQSKLKDSASSPVVIVLDDPVSSLDSNVLFIVSDLVSRILYNYEDKVCQSFILTHNVYFYMQIVEIISAFKKLKAEEQFYTVNKRSDISSIKKYDKNPINSSYSLLWSELNLLRSESSPSQIQVLIVQNIIRRIIERYFKYWGGLSRKDILDLFEGESRASMAALVGWENAGSHNIPDDDYYEPRGSIPYYLDIFRQLFERSGHENHYHMMMRDSEQRA